MNKISLSLFTGALVLCQGLLFAQDPGKKVLLRYNLKKGDTAAYNLVIKGKTTVSAMDQNQVTDLITKMKIEQKVTDVAEGKINVETTIQEGSVTVNGQPQELPVVGQKILMEMLPNGQVVKSEGLDQQQNLNQMQIKFPDTPQGVGDSWKTSVTPNPALPIPLDIKYEIKGFEKVMDIDCVKIQSEVKTGKSNEEGIDLDVQATGVIYFDYNRGVMVKNEVTTKMDMAMSNQIDGKMEKILTKMTMHLQMYLLK